MPGAISISWTIPCSAIRRFASALFDGMRGMGRLWQEPPGRSIAVLAPDLLERAVGCRTPQLFVGFETLNPAKPCAQRKYQNMRRDYAAAIRRLHDLGVMINGSFVFGMDGDTGSAFERTVEWAIEHGIETATFHILTPYPGTALHRRMSDQGRLTVQDWDLYDTRHAVFRPARMTAAELEYGYRGAYREFYRWSSIARGASAHEDVLAGLRHFGYSAGWKKFEPLWDFIIRAKRAGAMLPVLETILSEFGRRRPETQVRNTRRELMNAGATHLDASARNPDDGLLSDLERRRDGAGSALRPVLVTARGIEPLRGTSVPLLPVEQPRAF